MNIFCPMPQLIPIAESEMRPVKNNGAQIEPMSRMFPDPRLKFPANI
jgi:hypothetical protein